MISGTASQSPPRTNQDSRDKPENDRFEGWSVSEFVGRPEIFATEFNSLTSKDGGQRLAESTPPWPGVFSCP